MLNTQGDGGKIGEKVFTHGGEGRAAMAAWLMAASGPAEASANRSPQNSVAFAGPFGYSLHPPSSPINWDAHAAGDALDAS